jgi:hypothetical protein
MNNRRGAEMRFEKDEVIKLVLAIFISLLAFCFNERIIPAIILVIVLQMYWGCGE